MQSEAIKILIKNQKGGVGKSLIAFWLAAGIAQQRNEKVLILTSDSQDNIPVFAGKTKEAKSLTTGLETWIEKGQGGILELRENLYYIPLKSVAITQDNGLKFKNFIEVMSTKINYIIIDASPVLSLDDLFIEISDEIIIPTYLDEVTTTGIFNLMAKVGIKKIKAIIPNRSHNTQIEKVFYHKLFSALENTNIILTKPIKQSAGISKLINAGKTIWETKQKTFNPIREEFQKVIEVI